MIKNDVYIGENYPKASIFIEDDLIKKVKDHFDGYHFTEDYLVFQAFVNAIQHTLLYFSKGKDIYNGSMVGYDGPMVPVYFRWDREKMQFHIYRVWELM